MRKSLKYCLTIVLCMAMLTGVMVSQPLTAASTDHVIYEVTWLSDNSAKVTLKWNNPSVTTPIMITSWSVNDNGTVTIRYNQGTGVQTGFNSRTVSDADMSCPCVFLLRENVADNASSIFPDLPSDNEKAIGVEHLYHMGIINGYPDGTFKPLGNVTRAEFSKMLYVAGEMTDSLDSPIVFNDVYDWHWAKNYIYTLATKEIVNGKGAGRFDPEGTITIGEVLTIISRAFTTYGESYSYPYGLEDHWSNAYFIEAVEQGVVQSGDEFFRPYTPDRPATREECALLLSRVMASYFDVK